MHHIRPHHAAFAAPHHAVAALVVTHAVLVLHPHVLAYIRGVLSSIGALLRRPKVSVVTPTWQRRELLTGRCVPSVRAQAYDGEIEHVIVSDGPDASLQLPGVHFLPRHAASPNRGVLARRHGTQLATGEIIAYLDDDNAFRPRHLELLVRALEAAPWAGFAYSRAMFHGRDCSWIIGEPVPECGQVDTSLIAHRRGLLDVADWTECGDGPADWNLVARWLAAGVKWAFVPEVTLDYYVRPV